MKVEVKSAFQFVKQLYDRYLYLIVKPTVVFLFCILLVKLLTFIVNQTVDISAAILSLTFPFFLGILISVLLEPTHQWLQKRFKFSRMLAISLTLSVSVIVLSLFVFGIVYYALLQLVDLINIGVEQLKTYQDQHTFSSIPDMIQNSFLNKYLSSDQLTTITDQINHFGKNMSAGLEDNMSNIGKTIGTFTSHFFIHVIPHMLLVLMVSLFTTFFISKDKSKIVQLMHDYAPTGLYHNLIKVKNGLVKSLWSYFKGHCILVLISSSIVSIAFFVSGSPYAITLTLICLLLGNIPVVGHYILVVPLAVFALLTGDMFTFYMLIVFAILSSVVRHMIEPKILGDTLGIHPLLLMIALYAGVEAWGGKGVIVGPFVLVFVKVLFDTGIVKLKKPSFHQHNKPEKEKEE